VKFFAFPAGCDQSHRHRYPAGPVLWPTEGVGTPLIEVGVLFSHPSSYAIRALTYLAMQPPGKLTGTKEISAHEGIPSSFLGKVLIQLRRGRLVRSYKGIGGGYELALPPDRINLLMVVQCTGGEDIFKTCILEDRECSPQHHCALHESWISTRDQLKQIMERNTLVELVRAREERPIELPNGVGAVARLPDPKDV
jgi:Rrf2 family transcriptional regulator, iron-sulfur cluster assembly transcription factor